MWLQNRVKDINWGWVLLGLTVAFIVYLVISPLWMLIYSSFRTVGPGDPGPLTLDNYIKAYLSADTYRLLLNTVQFTFVSVLVGLVIGVFFAWLVERTNTPLRNVAFALIPLTMAMPSMLYGIAWLLLLSPRVGVVNLVLMHLFKLEAAPINPYSIVGMGFVEGLRLASSIFLMIVGVFRSMDPSLEEAAFASGAHVPTTMRRVTLRLMLPGILAAAIYSCTTAFDAFEIPAVLGMPRGIHVFATKIYLASHEIPPNYGMASTLGVLLVGLAVLWVYLYGRATRHSEAYATVTGKGYRSRVLDLGKWKYVGTALFFTHFAVVVIAPLSILVWGSLLPYYQIPSLEALPKLSLHWYREMLNSPWLLDALKNTLIIVLTAPAVAIIISSIIAWIIVRTRFRGRRILDVFAFLPHAIPGIVLSLSFLWLYLRLTFIPIYGTVWIMVLAFITRHMAYGTRSMNSAMLQIHKELDEAAYMSGASWLTTFSRITIPLLLPSVTAVWIWSVMQTIRDITLPIMLYSPNSRVLAVLIWDLWLSGEVPATCAIGVMLLIILAVLLFVGRIVVMRRTRQS